MILNFLERYNRIHLSIHHIFYIFLSFQNLLTASAEEGISFDFFQVQSEQFFLNLLIFGVFLCRYSFHDSIPQGLWILNHNSGYPCHCIESAR